MEHILGILGSKEPPNNGEERRGDEGRCDERNLTPCRNACGFLFCSSKCEESSFSKGGHSLLCTGLIANEFADFHPLIKWKVHAIQTNEIFLLVGQIISKIIASCLTDGSLSNEIKPYADFTNVKWWDVATKPLLGDMVNGGFTKAFELEKALKCICEESASLLKTHFGEALLDGPVSKGGLNGSCNSLLTRDFFASIIGTFEQNSIGIRLRNPIYESLTDGVDYGKAERERLHYLICRCAEEGDDEEEDGDDEGGGDLGMGGMEIEGEGGKDDDDEGGDQPFTPNDVTKVRRKNSKKQFERAFET
jgi:hypothetical protein